MRLKRTDFVQVEIMTIDPDHTQGVFWRNALYVHKTEKGHVVQYTDGSKQEISNQQGIRRAILNDPAT